MVWEIGIHRSLRRTHYIENPLRSNELGYFDASEVKLSELVHYSVRSRDSIQRSQKSGELHEGSDFHVATTKIQEDGNKELFQCRNEISHGNLGYRIATCRRTRALYPGDFTTSGNISEFDTG